MVNKFISGPEVSPACQTRREAGAHVTEAQGQQGWTLPNQVNRLFTLRKRWCCIAAVWTHTCCLTRTYYLLFFHLPICLSWKWKQIRYTHRAYCISPFLKPRHMARGARSAFISKQLWIKYERNQRSYKTTGLLCLHLQQWVCADGMLQLLKCFYSGTVNVSLMTRPYGAFVTLDTLGSGLTGTWAIYIIPTIRCARSQRATWFLMNVTRPIPK